MNCPVCNSAEVNLLYIINSEDSVNTLKEKKDVHYIPLQNHVKFLWQGDESRIVECKNCHLVYASPFIAGDAAYYNMAYSNNFVYPEWKWEFEKTREEFKNLDNIQNFNLLEIGAGTGEFLKEICDKYIKRDNIECTEYSDYGKSKIEKLGLKCYSLDIRDQEFKAGSKQYDIICMFQVLEHLDNLQDFFSNLNLLAKKNCLLFIGVPNDIQRKFFEKQGVILDVSPMHLTRWNDQSMNFLATKYGWSLLNHQREPQSYFQNIELFVRLYSQRKTKTFAKSESIKNNFIRKALKLSLFIFVLLKNITVIPKLFSKNLGTVQWFHLKKI